MHKAFRELLDKATGTSEFVVAVNVDVREFSKFSKVAESPNVAMFIKRVYIRLIDEYFSDACFFKPAGDGLLILIPYTEENLDEVLTNTVKTRFRTLTDFGSFCVNDRMINFDVPQKIGIGLSRGVACRLFSGDKTLDYSGRVLNLASRLMDLARPSGIVFDADFGIDCLPDEAAKEFEKESVYIKGIAEREPIDIYYSKDFTTIPPRSKQPIEELKWHVQEDQRTLKQIRDLGPRFVYDLTSVPIDPDEIKVRITHPCVIKGRRKKGVISFFGFKDFEYFLVAGKPSIRLQFGALAKRLEEEGVRRTWKIKIEIIYPKK